VVAYVVTKPIVQRVMNQRARMFGTFFMLPQSVVFKFASQDVRIDRDSDDDESEGEGDSDASDDDWLMRHKQDDADPGAQKRDKMEAIAHSKSNKPSSLVSEVVVRAMIVRRFVGRLLRRQKAAYGSAAVVVDATLSGALTKEQKAKVVTQHLTASASRYLAPILLWGAVGATAFIVSISIVEWKTDPTLHLQHSCQRTFYSARTLYGALRLCYGRGNASANAAELVANAQQLADLHNLLLYGTTNTSYAQDKGTLLQSEALHDSIFGRACLGLPSASDVCAGQDFRTVRNGMDVAVNAFLERAFALGAAGGCNTTTPEFQYMQRTGLDFVGGGGGCLDVIHTTGSLDVEHGP
jgi:hypothetical protein